MFKIIIILVNKIRIYKYKSNKKINKVNQVVINKVIKKNFLQAL